MSTILVSVLMVRLGIIEKRTTNVVCLFVLTDTELEETLKECVSLSLPCSRKGRQHRPHKLIACMQEFI